MFVFSCLHLSETVIQEPFDLSQCGLASRPAHWLPFCVFPLLLFALDPLYPDFPIFLVLNICPPFFIGVPLLFFWEGRHWGKFFETLNVWKYFYSVVLHGKFGFINIRILSWRLLFLRNMKHYSQFVFYIFSSSVGGGKIMIFLDFWSLVLNLLYFFLEAFKILFPVL